MGKRLLDLSAYRLEKAADDLDTADLMFKNNKLSWVSTINDRVKIYRKTVNTDAVNTLKSIVY